ncbi:MAG: 16S rRNA processing protein RimM [Bacteroidota bacterium]|nr:16S rRNA processing protein RimM [Bacteroidota bacterium]
MDYVQIGKWVATFGVNGELILQHALEKKSTFKGVEALFVEETKGNLLPYFIQSAKAKSGNESLVLLEGIASKEGAHRFIKKAVWLTQSDFEKVAGKTSSIGLLGFSIYEQKQMIGIVNEVIEQPHQILLRTLYQNKEAFIPLHEKTVDKIDRKKKEIHVTLPDGLLQIYL